VESYSIKQIEKFYLAAREGPITEAGFSVVEYERWLRDGDERHLRDLADYNRDDCISTLLLRDWLEERRREAILGEGWSVPRPVPEQATPSEALTDRQAAARAREAALRAGVPDDPAERTDEQAARWLLAALVDWHRRDAKPGWWEYFRLLRLSMEDLIGESAALAGLEYVGQVGTEARSIVHHYRFDPLQDTKIHEGDEDWVDPLTEKPAGAVVAFDPIVGTIDLRRSTASSAPHPAALIEPGPLSYRPLPEALAAVADHVIANGVEGPGRYRAVRDLLLRRPPRVAGNAPDDSLRRPGESALQAALRLATALDEGTLAIQGPPGTGKTWTGARMILELIGAGRRVGVTAQSHKAIANMLVALDEAARETGRNVRVIQKCDAVALGAQVDSVHVVTDPKDVAPALASGRYDVAAGTPWLFGRDDMTGAIDTLFVDEAGQLALANVVAMGGAARSIVLLGDPNQLPQVSQGIHPDGAGRSALEHAVGDHPTIAPDRGLLLDVTYRLHPTVNAFISEVFYAGQLASDPSTALQRIGGPDGAGDVGLRYVPIQHAGDATSSRPEADAVADAVAELIGRPWTDAHGQTRLLGPDDILVVAPYNAHVAEIERSLRTRIGSPGRVGTVDRFQGQEAPAAIYSMAASSSDDVPRGIEFLYNRNRFNVAVSRARGLSILVCSPELLRVRCRTPQQMRLANALCRYVEVAGNGAREPVAAMPRPGGRLRHEPAPAG
jgi:uncharacterized protein